MAEDRIFDELLVLRIQGGDRKALQLLIKRWNRKMHSKAYFLTNDYHSCQDIVQEAWYAVIKGINNLKDPKLFGAWVYRIVQAKSVDWIRARQMQRKTLETEKLEVSKPAEDQVMELSDQEDVIKLLRIALKRLPPDQRFILSLHYLEGNPVAETAKILGVPEGTVKSRLFKARKDLLKMFKKIKR